MNINGDVHFDDFPVADVKDFTFDGAPGFCVLRFVDTDQQQHQFFLKQEHLARARLAAAAFNSDLTELRRLLDIAEGIEDACKPVSYAEYQRQKAEQP